MDNHGLTEAGWSWICLIYSSLFGTLSLSYFLGNNFQIISMAELFSRATLIVSIMQPILYFSSCIVLIKSANNNYRDSNYGTSSYVFDDDVDYKQALEYFSMFLIVGAVDTFALNLGWSYIQQWPMQVVWFSVQTIDTDN